MKFSQFVFGVGVMAGVTALSSVSYAQTGGNVSTGAQVSGGVQVGTGTPPNALPPSRSDNDPQPQVAAPLVPTGGVVTQAGVGGSTAYGRPGVIELGGSIGLTLAGDLTQFNVSPSIGWFVADNLQLSGIADFRFADTGGASASSLNLLVEPSYHLPFSPTLFAFLGLGLGMSYSNRTLPPGVSGDSGGAGFALAPRLGLNIMIGRSGILTPALQFVYTTTDIITNVPGQTLVGVNTSFGLNIGYTIML